MKLNWFKSSEEPQAQICIRERLAYSFGNVGITFPLVLVTYLIMFYYTDYLGLNAGIVGTIFMAAKLIDAVTDITMGYLIDGTNSRWGKARPWILFSTPLYVVCLIATFAVPLDATLRLKYIWVAITYILINAICYTIIFTSSLAMNSLMTVNTKEQAALGAWFQALAYVSIFVLNSVTLKLIAKFGDTAESWTKVAIIYSILMAVFYILCFFGTKERVKPAAGVKREYTLVQGLKTLVHNKYWVKYTVVYFLLALSLSLSGAVVVYYATYIIEDVQQYGILSNMGTIAMVIMLTVGAGFAIKRLGFSIRWCNIVMLIGCALQLIAGNGMIIILIGAFIRGIAQGVFCATQGGLMAATATHVRLTSGTDLTGLSMSSVTFSSKVAAGIASGVTGMVLSSAGYDGTLAVQPTSALTMINVLYVVIPMIIAIIAFFVVRDYHLEDELKKLIAKTEQN